MARVVVVGGGFGGLASRRPAGQARPRGHPRRAFAVAGRRADVRVRGRVHLGRRPVVDAAARRHPRPVPQVRPAGGARARARAAAGDPRAPLRGRLVGEAARRLAGRPDRRARRARPGARRSGGSTTWRRTPTSGRRCAAATSRSRGTASTSPASWRRCWTAARSLHKRLKKDFKDERLRLIAGHRFVAEGHDLRNVPAWLGVMAYVEQRFGAWTMPGGHGRPRGRRWRRASRRAR